MLIESSRFNSHAMMKYPRKKCLMRESVYLAYNFMWLSIIAGRHNSWNLRLLVTSHWQSKQRKRTDSCSLAHLCTCCVQLNSLLLHSSGLPPCLWNSAPDSGLWFLKSINLTKGNSPNDGPTVHHGQSLVQTLLPDDANLCPIDN